LSVRFVLQSVLSLNYDVVDLYRLLHSILHINFYNHSVKRFTVNRNSGVGVLVVWPDAKFVNVSRLHVASYNCRLNVKR